MEKPRILSGEALVAKGITKIDACLPEVGLKYVIPDGSWLELKQIQASLEARKSLIEVERIEKCGTLSHAEWRDDLKLAEVTQKVGGYWQFLGHNVGKTLYLRPEEALFLMEVNCLLLKHNEVTVSLQKAYSLLLNSSISLTKYKVYASLSRLGYRVFRHTRPTVSERDKDGLPIDFTLNNCKNVDNQKFSKEKESENLDFPIDSTLNNSENVDSSIVSKEKELENSDLPIDSSLNNSENDDSSIVSKEKESENLDLPIDSTLNNSENVDSSIVSKEKESENCDLSIDSTLNNSENVDSSIVSKEKECENDYLPIDLTLNNCEDVGSPIDIVIKEAENVDSSVVSTAVEPEKAVSEEPMDKNVSSDSKSDNLIVDTVPDSEIGVTPKDDENVERSEDQESPIESQANKISENEQANNQEVTGSETNGNIVEMGEAKGNEAVTEQFNAENSVAKENECPNILEVDDPELKTADNNKMEIETIEEVSSTMTEINKNVENKIDSMEISTENKEATGSVLIEESDDKSNNKNGDASQAEKPNSMIKSDEPMDLGTQTIEDSTKCLEDGPKSNSQSDSNICTSTENVTQKVDCNKDNYLYKYSEKIEKLTDRRFKPSDSKTIQTYFENIPDFSNERVVTINVPEQQFMPKNISINKATYTLNLKNIKRRFFRSASPDSRAYSSSDEANGTNVRRIGSSPEVLGMGFPQNPNFFPQERFPRFNFRPYGFWRPQNNLNFYQMMFNQACMQYQHRPDLSVRPHVTVRPHLTVRPACFLMDPNVRTASDNHRKRVRTGNLAHIQAMKNLAFRVKQSFVNGDNNMTTLETLYGLLHSYNSKWKTRLRLNERFEVVDEDFETIDLDDGAEADLRSKKKRLEKDNKDKMEENLCRLRHLALRLRDLEAGYKATARHRRALSKAIKTFNTSYNADMYLDNKNYKILDRQCITLDSSSESDCVVEEQPQVRAKKLRNPFNILKRREERLQSLNKSDTSKDNSSPDPITPDPGHTEANKDNNKYSELIRKTFNETWLPNEKDFGRAEIVPQRLMKSRLEFSSKEQFLYEYMEDQYEQYQNWLEAKISFLAYLEESNMEYKRENARILADADLYSTELKPLIDFKDSSDMPSVLEKLRIINNNDIIDTKTRMSIDFDVYFRNVQNFRKRNPPKPHYRVICIDETSGVPSAAHVMSLHSQYSDNVPIVFAVVSSSSVSYLQINPVEIPTNVPNNDVV